MVGIEHYFYAREWITMNKKSVKKLLYLFLNKKGYPLK